jgi:hypothetical protein
LVKPWCVLVLGRGVSEDFLVARWRRSNRPHTRSNRSPLDSRLPSCFHYRGCVGLRLLVVFVPRTSSTPVATWFWQTEGRSAERVILGVRPSEFIMLEIQSPSRRIFIGSHSLPPLWSHNRSFRDQLVKVQWNFESQTAPCQYRLRNLRGFSRNLRFWALIEISLLIQPSTEN